jgi:hypothetical protein
MLKTLSPAIKGLITGLLMLAIALTLFYTNQPGDSGIQYIAYAIYAGGIVWTLIGYRQSPVFTGKFKDLFGQGFRCFIVVTLIMVTFTGIFSKTHPEFAEDTSKAYREHLLKEKTRNPVEIDKEVDTFKKQYTMRLVSASIFGYLIIGAVITAGCSAFLIRKNQ